MTGEVVRTIVDDETTMCSAIIGFSPDCSTVYRMHSEGVTSWDVTTGTRVSSVQGFKIAVIGGKGVVSPSGRYATVPIWTEEYSAAIFDMSGSSHGEEALVITPPTQMDATRSAWLPDDQHLISSVGHFLRFVSKSTLDVVREVKLAVGGRSKYLGMGMSSDGRFMATIGGPLEVWCASGGDGVARGRAYCQRGL